MKFRTLSLIAAMTFLAAPNIPVPLTAQEQQADKKEHRRYRVTDLGSLGGTFSEAVGINSRGWVAGSSLLPGDAVVHAFFWQKGETTDLGTLGGPNSVAPEVGPPNNRGEVAGFSDTLTLDPNAEKCFGGSFGGFPTPYTCLPFVWRNGVMTALPTLGGNNGVAAAINNRGQVAGMAENVTRDPNCPFLQFEPVIWEKDQISMLLPTVSGDADGIADGINRNGQAVGWTGPCAPVHAVLWENGNATDLGSLGGAVLNIAFAINNRGQVVGQSDLPGDTTHHAFLWQDGLMTDLGTLPGDDTSIALYINDKTQVVGVSFDASMNMHPFLWQNGRMTDLNTLIPADSRLFLLEALGINDRGQIAGYGVQTSTGNVHAFLATPCGEDHAEKEGCEDEAEGTTASLRGESSQEPRVIPENVREMLRHRPGFGRFVNIPQNATLSDAAAASRPDVTLSPTSLTFPTQVIGTTSATKTVTLKNTGRANLTISSIAITGANAGDFAQTHTCGRALLAGASCSISVTFKPTASGTRTAALSITDNAPGSPQKVMLSGVGTTAKLSTTSLSFGSVIIGKTSPAKAATLTNVGTTTLTISSIAITGTNAGDFAQTHTCGSSLPAGASCTISVTFKPTASGTRTASLSVTDNAHGSPQTVSLTGRGTVVELNPPSLNFGSVTVGQSSSQTTTLTNVENTQLHITTITITGTDAGDFSQQNNCPDPGDLGGGKSCAITVTFQPTQVGSRSAFVSVSDDGAGSPDQVSLSGTGQQSPRCSGTCGGPNCHRDCGCINGICVGSGLSGISGNLDMLWRKETPSELLCTRRPAIAFACQE